MNYYIGDWHYGHENAIRYDSRPFSDVSEMNEELVSRWNRTVKPSDTVYCLGDMLWKITPESLKALRSTNGSKILIIGNHDNLKNAEFKNCFDGFADRTTISDNGRRVVLDHYPSPCYNGRIHGVYHLYAHVHITGEYDEIVAYKLRCERIHNQPAKMYNAGCMMPYMDYAPQTLDTIETEAEKMYARMIADGSLRIPADVLCP